MSSMSRLKRKIFAHINYRPNKGKLGREKSREKGFLRSETIDEGRSNRKIDRFLQIQSNKALNRSKHLMLTFLGLPRRINGNKLGLLWRFFQWMEFCATCFYT